MNRWHRVLLGVTAIISVAAGFFIPHTPSHDAWWNTIPAFFACFGFLGCMVIIFFAKSLGKLFLQKKEDYYDAD